MYLDILGKLSELYNWIINDDKINISDIKEDDTIEFQIEDPEIFNISNFTSINDKK